MVPPRLNRASLPLVQSTTLLAAPGESSQGEDFLLQRMVDGDRQGPVSIHLGHLAEKILSMIWPPLEDVELPLMNHFVRERIDDLLLPIGAGFDDLLEQGQGEANFACDWRAKTLLTQPWSWSSTTHEHTDRGGQSAAPDEIDRRQQAGEVAVIEIGPHLGQLLRGHWRGLAWSHRTGVTPILRARPRRAAAP